MPTSIGQFLEHAVYFLGCIIVSVRCVVFFTITSFSSTMNDYLLMAVKLYFVLLINPVIIEFFCQGSFVYFCILLLYCLGMKYCT